MKVVILAGGLGSRLAEETVRIPKPMVEVGGLPVISHVMEIYSRWGHNDFIIACGYKGDVIKRYFKDYHLMTSDFTVSLPDGSREMLSTSLPDWNITLVDTGLRSMTGGRLLRLRDWLKDATFMVTYSDGLGNVNIDALLDFHRSHGKLATVTAVQPPARFGNLELDGDIVTDFTEKVRKHVTWINGGFFVFEPGIFDFLHGDDEPLEHAPLTELARAGQLMAFKHHGFWHPMDTIRDRSYLDELCAEDPHPWMDFTPTA
jgi:glucose-1-phosphate cytidylyltransferase